MRLDRDHHGIAGKVEITLRNSHGRCGVERRPVDPAEELPNVDARHARHEREQRQLCQRSGTQFVGALPPIQALKARNARASKVQHPGSFTGSVGRPTYDHAAVVGDIGCFG